MGAITIALALSASTTFAQASLAPVASKHIEKIMSKGDGASRATAYKVGSVRDEYEIVRLLGLETKRQALIVEKKAYDLLTVVDPATGNERELWFDISSFYGTF
jgi:hypothetical protein